MLFRSLIEVIDDSSGGWDIAEEFFAGASASLFLGEYRGAEFNAFAADVNIAGAFDQRPYISIVLATEGTILFGIAIPSITPTSVQVFTRRHTRLQIQRGTECLR